MAPGGGQPKASSPLPESPSTPTGTVTRKPYIGPIKRVKKAEQIQRPFKSPIKNKTNQPCLAPLGAWVGTLLQRAFSSGTAKGLQLLTATQLISWASTGTATWAQYSLCLISPAPVSLKQPDNSFSATRVREPATAGWVGTSGSLYLPWGSVGRGHRAPECQPRAA